MKKIERPAYVARTAHDRTHSNRLVVPEYGVVEIRLLTADKSKKSKSFLPATSQAPRQPTDGGEEVFQFAPGPQRKLADWSEDPALTDPVMIWYDLHNPLSAITQARLELFRRWDKNPLWSRELTPDELTEGEHTLEFPTGSGDAKTKDWNGAIPASFTVPEGFVTVDHSPYRLRLTVKGEGVTNSPVAWTYFHILIDKLELEWGEPEAIPSTDAAKRLPFTKLKAAAPKPTDGTATAPSKIFLVSNIFKTNSNQMFDNTLYTRYETLWGDGPEIPVFARVFIRDSKGNPVIAPRALGKTRFLWDWESLSAAPTNAFVTNAQNFDADTTHPKGQNCHADRGGKRGHATKKVFPAQAGYEPADSLTDGSFPFRVTVCDAPRTWASYSLAWTSGKLAGKTGVLFQPARMAGDRYRFTVYAAHEITDEVRKPRLNVDTDAPLPITPALKAASGIFETWRRLDFRRYLVKATGTSTPARGPMYAFYKAAFLDFEDHVTAVETYPATEWNTAVANVRNSWANADQQLIDPAVNQHAAGGHGFQFRTFDEYVAALSTTFFGGNLPNTQSWLATNNLDTASKHAAHCESLALKGLVTIFDAKMPASDGIALFHVDFSVQRDILVAKGGGFTDGQAADFPSASGSKCAFLWTAPISLYASKPQTVQATPAHEIGHHMMLPHPRNTAENTGSNANNDYSAHDAGVTNCLMSYADAVRELCGFCQLRQRGWNKTPLSVTSASNKRP